MSNYDKVFVNGKIFTANKDNPYIESFACKDGKVAWTGNTKDAPAEDCEIIDLEGKCVLPGFVDSHMHPMLLASGIDQIICLPPKINSIEELVSAVKDTAEASTDGEWVMGWGYDESKLAENRSPNRYDLDRGTTEHPVCLMRSCAHILCVNSKALELAGITKDTKDIEGGEIVRDENGEPTGILRENARTFVTKLFPPEKEEHIINNMLMLSESLIADGVTTIADMGVDNGVPYSELYRKADKAGFKQRVSLYPIWGTIKKLDGYIISEKDKDPESMVRIAGVKLISDGSISGRTAWSDRPYLGSDDEFGIPACTEDDIREAMDFAEENQVQISVHAMGAKAIDRVIKVFCEREKWLKDDLPHARVEHASMPTEYALKNAVQHGIAFNTQPIFLFAEIEGYLKSMDREWMKSTFPIKSIIDAGIKLGFSTDAPATPWAEATNPMYTLKAAVTRKAYNGQDCGQEHKIDLESAIRMYTTEGAEIMGLHTVGRIQEGYHADFVMLDRDIFEIPEEDIDRIKVQQAYMDGNLVYKR